MLYQVTLGCCWQLEEVVGGGREEVVGGGREEVVRKLHILNKKGKSE